jgi:KDO2-lipid IV(A) lauroyltransferase
LQPSSHPPEDIGRSASLATAPGEADRPLSKGAPDPANHGAARRPSRLAELAVPAMVGVLARLPLWLVRSLGALAGVLVFLGSARYRAKLAANLAQAGLDSVGMRWRVAAQAGQTLSEMPYIWSRTSDRLAARVRTEGFELIHQAQNRAEGILFLTPHLGAFDLAARYFAASAPITVMFRPPRLQALEPVLQASRNMGSMHAVPAGLTGVRAMIRALRAGEAVGLLPDQVPTSGQGVWADFFGRPAFTMTLPARLAGVARVTVLLAAAERVRGGWRLRIEPLEHPPEPAVLNAAMEALIRRCPEQYLWGYSRYRAPPATRSEVSEGARPSVRPGSSDAPGGPEAPPQARRL